jgi:rubrerythrin
MQRIYNMTTTVSLLPEELLVAAYAHETREEERYRMLALRFLPFDAVASRLLQMLADESEQRLEALVCVAEHLECAEFPVRPDMGGTVVKERHFFIVNERMAVQMLAQTLDDEHRSLSFYRQLADANATPQIHKLLAGFIQQKQAQIRVLEESQNHELVSGVRYIA